MQNKTVTNVYSVIRNTTNLICMSLILNATTEKSRQLKLKSDYVEENHSNKKIIVNFATIKEATNFRR